MVLFLFILAILAIVGISRYNEDDRLFWKLFASVTIAFAMTDIICSAYNKYNDSAVDSPVQVHKVYPAASQSPAIDFASVTVAATDSENTPTGYTNVPVYGGITTPSLEIPHSARGQPPNSCKCANTCPCKSGIMSVEIKDSS